jgi:uncharacterized protein
MTDTSSIPVVAGLFDLAGDGPALLGSRCPDCGSHYFPRRRRCSNPACAGREVEPVRFGRKGTLYSWSVQAYRPPPLFGMEPWAPYAIGLVDLPEGLRVMAMLTDVNPQDLQFGCAVELRLEPLRRDAEGRTVMTYKFAPVAAQGLTS